MFTNETRQYESEQEWIRVTTADLAKQLETSNFSSFEQLVRFLGEKAGVVRRQGHLFRMSRGAKLNLD